MPIFECSRCNELTYSASPDAARACVRCGSVSHRAFEGGFDDARRSGRALTGADHAALVYEDADRIAPFCARFLTDGITAGERVVAAIDAGLRSAITGILAADVDAMVDWQEPHVLYSDFDADRVAAKYEAMVADELRPTRILAGLDRETAAGVQAEELDCYERVAHGLITKYRATVVCLYDADALGDDLVAIAGRRHTLVIHDGEVRRSERFEYAPV